QADRLFFNLLDGLACDLEPMAPGAGHFSKLNAYLFKKKGPVQMVPLWYPALALLWSRFV
ncbi:hypothetical protein, partial [Neobacillus cucumis]|uniref:hypothetical protein n=1 Tax=Neobacillus cucumis TaxID=1740721 RepID=UPI002E228F08|nr:hypothetical protein [Neobacillus cucumis]